jgi:gliding motility-associated-like protein
MRFTLVFILFFLSDFCFSQIQLPCEVGKDRYICSDFVELETKSTLPGKWRFMGASSGTLSDPTNPKCKLTGISLPIVKVYWVNNDQSCADTLEIIQPKIGATSLIKNGLPITSNEFKLCFGDDWKASTNVTQGKSYVAYALYKTKPPITPNIYSDPEAFSGPVIFVNNDLNDGSLKKKHLQSSNEYWFVPTLYSEIGLLGPVVDPTCQITGEPFKITYYDKIEVEKTEDCMLGKVELSVKGGTGNYDVKGFSPNSILIDSSQFSVGKLNFSNVLVKQVYSVNIQDENQCKAEYKTKFSPCPACKTDVIYQKTYCVYDVFPKPALKEGAGIGLLELVPVTETNLVFDSLTGAIDIQASKPGKYIIRNKTSLSCPTQKYTDFEIEILDSIPLPEGKSIDTICLPNPKIGDIKTISAQLITWYDKNGQKLDPATVPAIHGNQYFCTQTIKGCESEKKQVKVFAPTITAPIADSIQYICNKSTDIAKNVFYPQGKSIIWYNTSGKKITLEDQVSPGFYFASQFLGCESKDKLKVRVKQKNVQFPYAVPDSFFYCKEQKATVNQITSQFNNSALYPLPLSTVYLEKYQLLDQGLYYIEYKDVDTKCLTERKKVWVNIPSFDISIKTKEPYCGFLNGELEFQQNTYLEKYEYFLNNKLISSPITNITTGEYDFKIIENSKLKCQLDTVLKYNCIDSKLQQLITPNADGLNDYLAFDLYRAYPDSKLLVYNRWGNLVFESVIPYKDNWNGVDISGNPLATGTYYYVIEKDRSQILKTGYIELVN